MDKSKFNQFRNNLSDDERKKIDDAKNAIYQFIPSLKELDSNGICGIGFVVADMNDAQNTNYTKLFTLDSFIRVIQMIANPPESDNTEEMEKWFQTLH